MLCSSVYQYSVQHGLTLLDHSKHTLRHNPLAYILHVRSTPTVIYLELVLVKAHSLQTGLFQSANGNMRRRRDNHINIIPIAAFHKSENAPSFVIPWLSPCLSTSLPILLLLSHTWTLLLLCCISPIYTYRCTLVAYQEWQFPTFLKAITWITVRIPSGIQLSTKLLRSELRFPGFPLSI